MFLKLRPRTFAIGLLVFSSLWLAITIFPFLHSVVSPPRDLQSIVRALELRGTAPPQAAAIVQQTMAAGGPLRRAVQVGYDTGLTVTLQFNASHRSKKTQVIYLAWFQKIPKPLILVINGYEIDGVLYYEIGGGERMSFVRSYIRSYGLPLLTLGVSLYLVRRRKSLNDPAS